MTKRVESLEKQMKNKVDSQKRSKGVKKRNTEVKNLQKDIKGIETNSTIENYRY